MITLQVALVVVGTVVGTSLIIGADLSADGSEGLAAFAAALDAAAEAGASLAEARGRGWGGFMPAWRLACSQQARAVDAALFCSDGSRSHFVCSSMPQQMPWWHSLTTSSTARWGAAPRRRQGHAPSLVPSVLPPGTVLGHTHKTLAVFACKLLAARRGVSGPGQETKAPYASGSSSSHRPSHPPSIPSCPLPAASPNGADRVQHRRPRQLGLGAAARRVD